MSSQPALGLLAQDPRTQAMVPGVHTPDLAAFVKAFYETWACPTTSPDELERLLERSRNRPPPKENDTIFGGQCIHCRLSKTERIRPADFIDNSKGYVGLSSVLISPLYEVSYIFADTLASLGLEFVPVKIHTSRNPMGGKLFEPIGIATLVIRFTECPQFHDIGPFFTNFLVLDEWSAEKGVFAIFGKQDMERVFGTADLF